MARRELALFFLLLAPGGRARQLAGTHSRGETEPQAEIQLLPEIPGIPDVAGGIAAAEEVLVNINASWDDMQDLFNQASQTAVDSVDSATAKVDGVGVMLVKLQGAVNAINSMPFAPGNTDSIQDLVDVFSAQVNASTQVARNKILAVESTALGAIAPVLGSMRQIAESVLLKFRWALERMADLAYALEGAVANAQKAIGDAQAKAAASFLEKPARAGSLDDWSWPVIRLGSKKESAWATATSAIARANETLVLFQEKVDGINGTLMEIIVTPILTAAEDAMNTFATNCKSAVYQLPDIVSAPASSVCGVAADFNGVFSETIGKLEGSIAEKVDAAKEKLGSVFGLVESLVLLVAKVQHTVEILNDRAAAAVAGKVNVTQPLAPPSNHSQEVNKMQPVQPVNATVKPGNVSTTNGSHAGSR